MSDQSKEIHLQWRTMNDAKVDDVTLINAFIDNFLAPGFAFYVGPPTKPSISNHITVIVSNTYIYIYNNIDAQIYICIYLNVYMCMYKYRFIGTYM